MHACMPPIAMIPPVGIAYSKKFKGVFGNCWRENLIADPRTYGKEEIMKLFALLLNIE